jgi:Icc protein
MLAIVQLTDTRRTEPGRAPCGTDPVWRLGSAIEAPDARHADALGRLRMPVHLAIGEHDDRSAFRRAFPGTCVIAEGFAQCAFDAGGLRRIVLDAHELPQCAVVLPDDENTIVHLHDFDDASARFDL